MNGAPLLPLLQYMVCVMFFFFILYVILCCIPFFQHLQEFPAGKKEIQVELHMLTILARPWDLYFDEIFEHLHTGRALRRDGEDVSALAASVDKEGRRRTADDEDKYILE